MNATCRLCGSQRLARLATRPDLEVLRCRECGFVSGWPTGDLDTTSRYADYYHGAILQAPHPEQRYDEWLGEAERRVGRGHLLEVGAGSGGFVQSALRRGWRVDATEVSASGLAHLRETGATVFAGDLHEAGFETGAFDLAISLEVLEHLPAPRPHLAELARVLRPGGLLLLSTPSVAGLSWRVLGGRWRVVDPEHLGYFTPRTLRGELRRHGFDAVSVRSRGLDVTTWSGPAQGGVRRFDPVKSAHWRDGINASALLRSAKDGLNRVLALTGLGDSLLAWARRA